MKIKLYHPRFLKTHYGLLKINIFFILVAILMVSLFSGCGTVKNKKLVYKTNERYAPYRGEVKVYWKEHSQLDPNSYTLIATISASPFWAGVQTGKNFEPLHQYIIDKTAEIGGNAVIIYCGEIGTVAQHICYGDAIRLK